MNIIELWILDLFSFEFSINIFLRVFNHFVIMFQQNYMPINYISPYFPSFQQFSSSPFQLPTTYITPVQTPLNQRSKNIPIKGTWSVEEDEALRKAVSGSKPIFWDVVAKSIPGRTPKQCRERWTYRLQPDLKKTPFEKWEDDLIFEQKKKIGNRWTQIALQLPGRTSCSVKNRWYTVLRNKVQYQFHSNDESNLSEHESPTSDPDFKEQEESCMLSISMLLNH